MAPEASGLIKRCFLRDTIYLYFQAQHSFQEITSSLIVMTTGFICIFFFNIQLIVITPTLSTDKGYHYYVRYR